MRKTLLKTALVAAFLSTSGTAMADHNSPMGEGWARMPNDIHNTRVETRGDNTAFRDFVRRGKGADTTNRFLTDTSSGSRLDRSSHSDPSARMAGTRSSSNAKARGGRR